MQKKYHYCWPWLATGLLTACPSRPKSRPFPRSRQAATSRLIWLARGRGVCCSRAAAGSSELSPLAPYEWTPLHARRRSICAPLRALHVAGPVLCLAARAWPIAPPCDAANFHPSWMVTDGTPMRGIEAVASNAPKVKDYLISAAPLRIAGDRISGAVVTMVDLSQHCRGQEFDPPRLHQLNQALDQVRRLARLGRAPSAVSACAHSHLDWRRRLRIHPRQDGVRFCPRKAAHAALRGGEPNSRGVPLLREGWNAMRQCNSQ